VIACAASAHETDQFTVPLGKQFADMGETLNGWIYETLEGALERTNTGIREAIEADRDREHIERLQSPDRLARSVFGEFSAAFFLIENIENSLHYTPTKKRFPGRVVGYRETIKNIYQNVHFPLDPRQLFRIWHASTMKVHGTYMGPDKVGHFTDMGYQYYLAYRKAETRGADEAEAFAAAVRVGTKGLLFAEEGMVGFLSAGAYSNADLAANYIGLKFYLNLTEPQMLEGELRPPLLEREGEYWRLASHVRRDTDVLAWFISDHLNEALNPSYFESGMRPAVRKALAARADRLLEWYADDNGARRPREFFERTIESMRTYWGEEYGYRGELDELVSIASGCFEEPPEDLSGHERSANGYAALHWAAYLGDADLTETLLADGAAVDDPIRSPGVANSDWGCTPLHVAAAAGAVEVARVLLHHGADPDAQALNGVTPLHRAIGHPQIVEVLLAAGADVETRSDLGLTPLHLATAAGRVEATTLLVSAGADPSTADDFGLTPLHEAARRGHVAVVTELLEQGAGPDVPDYYGSRPLHLAARQGKETVAEILLAAGADLHAVNELGSTPLHEAVAAGRAPMLYLLVAHGGDPSARNAEGKTALELARWERSPELAVLRLSGGQGLPVDTGTP
jgi:ankyrin repeat protein